MNPNTNNTSDDSNLANEAINTVANKVIKEHEANARKRKMIVATIGEAFVLSVGIIIGMTID